MFPTTDVAQLFLDHMFNNGPTGDWNGSRVGESSKDLFQDDHLGESSKIYIFLHVAIVVIAAVSCHTTVCLV